MSEDNVYQDADIVWVKLGTSWWPGEVCGHQRQPEGFLKQAKRKPYCVVKFFQEDSFEYVKSSKHILPFNCSKKDEFIRKGHELFKAKKKFMEKFPSDVSTAERLTRSVTRSSLFFNTRPDSIVKAVLGESPFHRDNTQNGRRCGNVTKIINITPNRYSGIGPLSNASPTYKCSMCDFQSTRQNVMVLHRKSHSGSTKTANRSSVISSSTMTSTKTVSVGTSPLPIETSTFETPIRRRKISEVLIDTVVDIRDESDNSLEENTLEKKNINNSLLSQKSDLSTEQNELNTITNRTINQTSEEVFKENVVKSNHCKSVEIQKSLLADWIDEDRDDEEEYDQNTEEEKKLELSEVITKLNKTHDNSTSQTLNSASVEISTRIEPFEKRVVSPDPQKAPSKIRNIPKKDRRNIVLADFNISEELVNNDSSSQHTSEDSNHPQEKSSEECRFPTIERSALDSPVVELPKVGPHGIESPAEGLSTVESFTSTMKSDNVKEDIPSMKNNSEIMGFKEQPLTEGQVPVTQLSEESLNRELPAVQKCALNMETMAKTDVETLEDKQSFRNATKKSITLSKRNALSSIKESVLKPISTKLLTEDQSLEELPEAIAATVNFFSSKSVEPKETTLEVQSVNTDSKKSSEIIISPKHSTDIKVEPQSLKSSTMELFKPEASKQHKGEPSTEDCQTMEIFSVPIPVKLPTLVKPLEAESVRLYSENVSFEVKSKSVEPLALVASHTIEQFSEKPIMAKDGEEKQISGIKHSDVESCAAEICVVESAAIDQSNNHCVNKLSTVELSFNIPSIERSVEMCGSSTVESNTGQFYSQCTEKPCTDELLSNQSPIEEHSAEMCVVETSTVESVKDQTFNQRTDNPSTKLLSSDKSCVEWPAETCVVKPPAEESVVVTDQVNNPRTDETYTEKLLLNKSSIEEPAGMCAAETVEHSEKSSSAIEKRAEMCVLEPSDIESVGTDQLYTECTKKPSTEQLPSIKWSKDKEGLTEMYVVKPSTAETVATDQLHNQLTEQASIEKLSSDKSSIEGPGETDVASPAVVAVVTDNSYYQTTEELSFDKSSIEGSSEIYTCEQPAVKPLTDELMRISSEDVFPVESSASKPKVLLAVEETSNINQSAVESEIKHCAGKTEAGKKLSTSRYCTRSHVVESSDIESTTAMCTTGPSYLEQASEELSTTDKSNQHEEEQFAAEVSSDKSPVEESVDLSALEQPVLEPLTVESISLSTEEVSTVEPSTSKPKKSCPVTLKTKQTAVEPAPVKRGVGKRGRGKKLSASRYCTRSHVVESPALNQNAGEISTIELVSKDQIYKSDQHTVESSTADISSDISSSIKPLTVEGLRLSIENVSRIEPSTPKPIEQFKVEDTPTANQSGVEQVIAKRSTGKRGTGKKLAALKYSTKAEEDVHSSTLETFAVEPPIPAAFELGTVESVISQPVPVEVASAKPSKIESSAREPSRDESICKSLTVEKSIIEASPNEPHKVVLSMVGSDMADSSIGKLCTTQSSNENFPVVEASNVTSTSAKTSRREVFKAKRCSKASIIDPLPLKESAVKSCRGRKKVSTFKREACVVKAAESTDAMMSNVDTCNVVSSKTTLPLPTDLEPKQLSHNVDHQTTNSISKSSLSCFDFQEEEDTDILTSIAKFKKKYISPEKKLEDIRPKTPDAQKTEMELKDKQLSADIESLLKTTALTIELPAPSSITKRSISNEVLGLPIKERGKRIFKSRNRSKIESCSSVSTTSTVVTESSSPRSISFTKNEMTLARVNSVEKIHDAVEKDKFNKILTAQTPISNEETTVYNIDSEKGDTMDDKVTNSEEEIVGRVAFSPAEVYAPSDDYLSPESLDNRESHVSSSGMEVLTESPSVSDVNSQAELMNCDFNNLSNQRYTRSAVRRQNRRQADLNLASKSDPSKCMFSISQQEEKQDNLKLTSSKIIDRQEIQTTCSQIPMEEIVNKQEELVQQRVSEDIVESCHIDRTELKVNGQHLEIQQEDHIQSPENDNKLIVSEIKECVMQPIGYCETDVNNTLRLCVFTVPEVSKNFDEQTKENPNDQEERQHDNCLKPSTFKSSVSQRVIFQEDYQNASSKDSEVDSCNVEELQSDNLISDTQNVQNVQQDFQTEYLSREKDDLFDYFVVAENEPINEVEVCDGDSNGAANGQPNLNNEINSIVARIIIAEEEHACNENKNELLESGIESTNMGTFTTTSCNVVESHDFSMLQDVQGDNSYVNLKDLESTESCSTMEVQSKTFYLEKGIRSETLEDERIQVETERAETSSDDTSTVISDAEAEFGSPTSMLEEDRLLNTGRSESETPTTNIECITNIPKGRRNNNKVIKRTTRRRRFQLPSSRHKLRIPPVQYDAQESTEEDGKKHKMSENLFPSKEFKKAETSKGKCTPEKRNLLVNQEHIESNTDSDSTEEEEEEICSPPIESLQDESTEGGSSEMGIISNIVLELPVGRDVVYSQDENISGEIDQFEREIIIESENIVPGENETEPLINSQKQTPPKNEQEQKVDSLIESQRSIEPEFQHTTTESNVRGSLISMTKEAETQSCKPTSSYYTITQKSDTIIKFNKHKDVAAKVEVCKEWNVTNVDSEKSDIAGEELSAAEALLLIPTQPSNNLDNINDLSKSSLTASVSTLANECLIALPVNKEKKEKVCTDQEIKEEILENADSPPLEQVSLLGDIPKEVVRRKRRSHMKVTPRKRIIETDSNLANVCVKIPKLSQDNQLDQTITQADEKKSFAEQYEENFILKYSKDEPIYDGDSIESSRRTTEDSDKSLNPNEKVILEKINVQVDIDNPLSSQISNILPSGKAIKRKQTLEDDIPSFIIKRPSPKTIEEAEAADRETIAQLKSLCPHVEITRKYSKDEQLMSNRPHIINQQILRTGSNTPLITVTPLVKKLEESAFDSSTLSVVLSSQSHDKLQQPVSPSANNQVVKQFQNQQLLISNPVTQSVGSFGTPAVNITNHGIPNRRPSNVRTKRTPSRQQLQEQQNQEQQLNQLQHHQEQEKQQQNQSLQNQQQNQHQQSQQQLNLQQQYHQQHQQQQLQHHQHQQQHQFQLQQQQQYQHFQQQHQRHPQVQLQHQYQQQQHFQQQFQLHHQNQIQQQIQEEQQILIQQHQQQLLLQQQLQMQQQHQHQQQHQQQHHQPTQTSSDKQMGVDNRGNKYVIIKAPSNTVVMGNSTELNKGVHRVQQPHLLADTCNTNTQQRKQKQTTCIGKKSVSQSPNPVKPTLPKLLTEQVKSFPSLPVLPYKQNHSTVQTREINSSEVQQHFKEIPVASPIIPVVPPTMATKSKGQGRGRRPKQCNKLEPPPPPKESTSKTMKNNTMGKRSSGSICEPPRQRSTRSSGTSKKNSTGPCSPEMQGSVATDFISPPIYTTTQQQTQSVVFMDPQPSSSICTNNMPFHVTSLTTSMMPRVISGISIETADGSGVGYAVPSLPVPGYPETFLLCELIDKKYREVSSKPLYLSPDHTKFFEVPDELVTDAHRKLTDFQREPKPDVLQVISDVAPYVPQLQQKSNVEKPNEILTHKHDQLSVEEQASALLCLQDQIVQEQFVQEQLVQDQLSQHQIAQEQHERQHLVREQITQEQLVQEHFVQEQYVQEQFMQQNIDGDQGILQAASIQTEEDRNNIIQQLASGSIVLNTSSPMVVKISGGQLVLEDNTFYNVNEDGTDGERVSYTLTPETIQELFGTLPGTSSVVCEDGQIIMNENLLHNEESSSDILTVALDDSGLYTEEQYINSGEILQIETPEGLRLISTGTGGNSGIVFQPMTTPITAKTNETNVLLNQAPKMSVVEVPSGKSKKHETDSPVTAGLENCLTVIGASAQSPSMPTSLELPISVTNPAIVAKTRTPTPGTITMDEIIATGLCHHPDITSLPPMASNEQELHYEFFSSSGHHDDKVHINEESVVADMGEYAVVSSGDNFDDPGR